MNTTWGVIFTTLDKASTTEDNLLKEKVSACVFSDPIISSKKDNINIIVENLIVTLEGKVSSEDAKWAAGANAFWTEGVLNVVNNLQVYK